MPRSSVRSGRWDARDRATQRRRSHRAQPSPRPPSWEDAHDAILGDLTFEALAQLDLDAFLRRSADEPTPAHERLRRLAIWLEGRVVFSSLRQTFDALHRVYRRAIVLCPTDPWVHGSLGITASTLAYGGLGRRRDPSFVRTLHARAHASLAHAHGLAPADPDLAWSRGYALYVDPEEGARVALPHFDQAIRHDPNQAWARLYRAHCLHDLERWTDAASAYADVPKERFDGPRSWRMDLLVEQQGLCLLRAGDRDGARGLLEAILSRYEAQPHLGQWGDLAYLQQAADLAFADLQPRLDTLRPAL